MKRTGLRGGGTLLLVLLTALGGDAVAQQHKDEPQKPSGMNCPCPGMGGSGMGGMMGCPMMSSGMGEVKVEKTKDGAVIRMTAKDSAQVENLQRMALMMGLCMGADVGEMMPAPKSPR